MKAKKTNQICLFLACIMFISGMCFDIVKADSVFLNPSEYPVQQEFIETENPAVENNDACTEEMIGVKNTALIQQYAKKNTHRKNDLRFLDVFLELLCTAIQREKLSITIYTQQFVVSPYECAVLEYIHNKDGKKRN